MRTGTRRSGRDDDDNNNNNNNTAVVVVVAIVCVSQIDVLAILESTLGFV